MYIYISQKYLKVTICYNDIIVINAYEIILTRIVIKYAYETYLTIQMEAINLEASSSKCFRNFLKEY